MGGGSHVLTFFLGGCINPVVVPQQAEMARFAKSEALELEPGMDFTRLHSISKEEVQLLTEAAPATLFAASRIPGVYYLRVGGEARTP